MNFFFWCEKMWILFTRTCLCGTFRPGSCFDWRERIRFVFDVLVFKVHQFWRLHFGIYVEYLLKCSENHFGWVTTVKSRQFRRKSIFVKKMFDVLFSYQMKLRTWLKISIAHRSRSEWNGVCRFWLFALFIVSCLSGGWSFVLDLPAYLNRQPLNQPMRG